MYKVTFLLILTTLCNSILMGNNANLPYYSTEDSVIIIEKVYLHTDRDIYSPGDNIWFKGYMIDASNRFLTNHSNNLHVELISPDSKIIDSQIVRLEEGLGNGDFQLPKIMISGSYRIRAYTNYMRNFGNQLFFIKHITIINSSTSGKDISDSVPIVKNQFEVSFFPEGGSLVDNVPSVVGFKAVTTSGASCDVSGELFSSSGELITTFKSVHKGMGRFTFTPDLGLDYYAIVKNLAGDEVKSEIPKRFPTGLVLNINRNLTNELGVTVLTNQKTLSLTSEHDFTLSVSAHNIVYKTINFNIKSLNDSLILPTDDFPDGIVALTLSGAGNKPLCERLVYIQNNEDLKINLETNKTIYKQRDSVSVKISMSDNNALAPVAYASFSATEGTSTYSSSQFPSTISSWFLLESDVHGPVEEPSYYFDPSNPDRLIDLDLLLLTQGWRDFEWKFKNMNYHPETGFTISGKVRKILTDEPLKNSKVNIGIFKNGKPFITTVLTDSLGRFYLKGIDITGSAKLIVSSVGDNDEFRGWLLLDSFDYSPDQVQNSLAQKMVSQNNTYKLSYEQLTNDNELAKENLRRYIQYTEIKNSVQKKYKLSDTINIGEVNIIAKQSDAPESPLSKSRRFLMSTPDASLVITPQLLIYNNTSQLIKQKFFIGGHVKNPLFLLDGSKVSWEAIAGLPVDWVERVDMSDNIASYAVFGTGTGKEPIDGVISIITRDIPRNTSTKDYHSINTKISGYNEPRIFYSPKHNKPDYNPDLRTTLFWEPNITLENGKDYSLKFYNADISSIIKICVEGITTTGIPITGSINYKVQ